MAKQKRPHDIRELAELIVDSAVGVPAKGDLLPDGTADPAAPELSRKAARKAATRRAAKPSAKKKRAVVAKRPAKGHRGR